MGFGCKSRSFIISVKEEFYPVKQNIQVCNSTRAERRGKNNQTAKKNILTDIAAVISFNIIFVGISFAS